MFGRKIIAWPVVWLLFWFGDGISRIMNFFDWGLLYPVYNRSMIWSLDLQEWAGNDFGPWRE